MEKESFLIKKIHSLPLLIKQNWKSGLSVALVSIPLAISLAVASNTIPIVGIITAVWAGLAASFFSGSNYNIVGPTGALSGMLTVYAINYGPESFSMLAIFAGIFIFLSYFLKLEKYLAFFPANTFQGFILGIAIIISLGQFNYAFGINSTIVHEKLLRNFIESLKIIHTAAIPAIILFSVSLILLFLLTKAVHKIPAIVLLSPFSILIGYLSTNKFLPFFFQTLESKYPNFSTALFIKTPFNIYPKLLVPACTIALVAIIETMISARIADGITKTKHSKKKEILGLGIANIVSGLAGGMPATAAFARTDLNIRTGCTNKISATISSIFITIIVLLFFNFFKFFPLPAIAAMLVFTSVRMVEKKHLFRMYKIDKKNFALALLVAGITVYEDPIIGLFTGATISMLSFMVKLSKGQFDLATKEQTTEPTLGQVETKAKKFNLLIYSIKGQLAYINAQSHIARFENHPTTYHNVLLDLKNLYFIDLDGADALISIIDIVHSQNKNIFISGINEFNQKLLKTNKKFNQLQEKSFVFETIEQAIKYIKELNIKSKKIK